MFNVKELIEPLMANLTESGLDENQTGYLFKALWVNIHYPATAR